MNIRNIGLMVLAVVLFACSQPSQKESFKTIVLKKSQDILPISSFAAKVNYTELKVSETGLTLGEIESVKLIDDDLIVKHRMSGKSSFLRFTGSGEFVIELVGIKSSGINQPQDIVAYDDGFAVLAENGIFTISNDGKYTGQLVRGTMPGSRFFFADGAFHVINESDRGNLIKTFPAENRNSKVSEKLPEPVRRMTYSAVASFGKGETHFYSALNDTVFSFGGNSTVPVYAFQGNNIPTFSQLCKNTTGLNDTEALRYLRENEHVIVRKYLENRNYIFMTYWVGSNSSTAIVNKKSGETRYFGHGVNDLDGGVWDKVNFLSDKDELLVPITAYKVGGHKITNKKEKRFADLQKRIEASGNPVIMRLKLR
mgnify:FL=1